MRGNLKLPFTLRSPKPDEVPSNSKVSEQLEKRKNVNIVEGYVLHQKDNNSENEPLHNTLFTSTSYFWFIFLNFSSFAHVYLLN